MNNTRYVYGIYYDGEIVYTGSTKNMKRRWREYRYNHINPKSDGYRMKICQFMREKGFNNFSHEIIETFEDITKQDILKYEVEWQETLEDLGFNLLNKNKAIGVNSNTYANQLVRNSQKIPCEFCGVIGRWGDRRTHQRTQKCLKVLKDALVLV